MQVSETKSEGLKRDFKIVVPSGDIEEQISSRLKELARTIQMPGFRPGKVPVSLLRKKYGTALMGEVIERAVNDSSQKALTDRGLRPAMEPKIEITSFEDGADLEYTMAVELMPQIEPVDFSKIKLEHLVAETDEAEIDKSVQRLAETRGTQQPISANRKSRKGDIAVIDFVGRVDGEEFPGGQADGYLLELGAESFIPGFEDQLIGVKAGDHVQVKVTFPEDYGAQDLAGKSAVFDVDIKELRETEAAPIDDALAKKLGMENLEALRQALREDMEREYRALSRMRIKRDLLDSLAEFHDFEVPEGMVEREFEQIWNQVEEQRRTGDEDPDIAGFGKSDEEKKAQLRKISERRVRLGLVLSEVGRLNNIQVSQEDLTRALTAEARRHPGQEQAVFDHYRKTPEAMESLRAPVLEEKVVDFILEMAEVSERSVSVEELLREPDDQPVAQAEAAKTKSESQPKKGAPKKRSSKSKEKT